MLGPGFLGLFWTERPRSKGSAAWVRTDFQRGADTMNTIRGLVVRLDADLRTDFAYLEVLRHLIGIDRSISLANLLS